MIPPWLDSASLARQANEAREAYLAGLDPIAAGKRWHAALDEVAADFARKLKDAFGDGSLTDAIAESGAIVELLRQLTAPPLSQDQFKLLCPAWSKGTEKSGRAIANVKAKQIADVIERWIDPRILDGLRNGRIGEVAAGPIYILARQKFETDRRTAAARGQELAVVALLEELGYEPADLREIDQPWTVGSGRYMHKTTFRGAAQSTAEVDVAVGLAGGRLLALECKVSNDATNSIKRVNDVLKKRESWEKGYGGVLTTGAVLSGVIAPRDVLRLASQGVCVFFSHDLDGLRQYLSGQS
ncbi:MAG: XamI family restriction endonuclease [Planctomycetota bacterium]